MARDGDVQFRGTKGGLLVRFDEGEDFQQLKERLAEKLDSAWRYFHGSAVTIDVGNRVLTTEQLLEIEAMFTSRYGVRILQVVNGGEGDESPSAPQGEAGGDGQPAPRRSPVAAARRRRAPVPPDDLAEEDTLLLRRTVRSGQRVSYNGNIVVLGDVNPGGELVASGDVLVLGALRGVVHAGARGDERAIVLAIRLEPTQLRIANVIGRAPDADGAAGSETPEVARIRDGEIVIDPYTGAGGLEAARRA